MGKMKELFMRQAEDAFMRTGMLGLETFMDKEDEDYGTSFETETVKFTKGNYDTTVTVRFNSKGFPVLHSCEAIIKEEISQQDTENHLQTLIDEAVSNKDFRAALIFQNQLDDIKKPT